MFAWPSWFRWDVRRWSNRRLALAASPAYALAFFLLLAAVWRLTVAADGKSETAPPVTAVLVGETSTAAIPVTDRSHRSTSDYDAIWKRNLREAYKPPKTATPTPAKKRPELKLVGTIIEPPNNLAVIVGASGEKRIVGVGESAFGVTVKRIGELNAIVDVEGEEFELKREQP